MQRAEEEELDLSDPTVVRFLEKMQEAYRDQVQQGDGNALPPCLQTNDILRDDDGEVRNERILPIHP